MPGRKHLRGVGSKEPRQYEHIKDSAENSGRYGERAGRLVMAVIGAIVLLWLIRLIKR